MFRRYTELVSTFRQRFDSVLDNPLTVEVLQFEKCRGGTFDGATRHKADKFAPRDPDTAFSGATGDLVVNRVKPGLLEIRQVYRNLYQLA